MEQFNYEEVNERDDKVALMTRTRFKQNLMQAVERKDCYVTQKDIDKFIELNYEEVYDWDYDTFTDFAIELCANWCDFWKTVAEFDLKTPAYVG